MIYPTGIGTDLDHQAHDFSRAFLLLATTTFPLLKQPSQAGGGADRRCLAIKIKRRRDDHEVLTEKHTGIESPGNGHS
jgi:hypothetical protein